MERARNRIIYYSALLKRVQFFPFAPRDFGRLITAFGESVFSQLLKKTINPNPSPAGKTGSDHIGLAVEAELKPTAFGV